MKDRFGKLRDQEAEQREEMSKRIRQETDLRKLRQKDAIGFVKKYRPVMEKIIRDMAQALRWEWGENRFVRRDDHSEWYMQRKGSNKSIGVSLETIWYDQKEWGEVIHYVLVRALNYEDCGDGVRLGGEVFQRKIPYAALTEESLASALEAAYYALR